MVFWDWSQFLMASVNSEIRRRWCTRIVRTHGCGMWKNIRASAKSLEPLSGCIVCSGSRSSYSVLVQSLERAPSSKGSLSQPFCLLCSKNAWISDLIISSSEGGGRSWSIHFYRAFHNCVLGGSVYFLWVSLFQMPSGKSDNNLTWQLSRNGFFDVHSYYNSLSGPLIASFPWKNIWCVKVPKRVSFFL